MMKVIIIGCGELGSLFLKAASQVHLVDIIDIAAPI